MDQLIRDIRKRWSETRIKLEKELEEAGVIAYMADYTTIVIFLSNGKSITIQGFFYPEGAFMNINGEPLSALSDEI